MASIFKKRQSKGRQKIEIKRIEKEEARQICFSKRKAGIFKKANELAILCGAEVGIVTFSPAGRAFSFGHPNIHSLINRYLLAGNPSTTEDLLLHHPETSYFHDSKLNELQREHDQLLSLVDAVKKQQQEIKGRLWWDVDIEGLGFEDLIKYVKVLEELKMKVLNITAAKSVLHHHHPGYSLVHSGSVEGLSLHANNVLSDYSLFDGFNERFGWNKGRGIVPGCAFATGFDEELRKMEGLHASVVNGFDQRQVNGGSLHGCGQSHMGFFFN
ncbi:putative transcription factor MADS-type1 family [Dioscorea sansibarensis]